MKNKKIVVSFLTTALILEGRKANRRVTIEVLP